MRFTQYSKTCGVLWGNGGDLPGFSSKFFNSEDGKVQAGVIINVNPIPKAVSGEPLGQTKATAVADALGREHCQPPALGSRAGRDAVRVGFSATASPQRPARSIE